MTGADQPDEATTTGRVDASPVNGEPQMYAEEAEIWP